MKLYAVKEGAHDFKPNTQPIITFSNEINAEFRFTESMYFNREDVDYNFGNDVYDINKLFGLGYFPFTNRLAAMFGYRPDQDTYGSFELFCYLNYWDSRNFYFKKLINFKVNQLVKTQLIRISDKAVFKVWINEKEKVFETMDFVRNPFPRWFRGVGPWFGGNRPAHKEMRFFADIKYK